MVKKYKMVKWERVEGRRHGGQGNSEKVMFQLRPEWGESDSCLKIWGKSVSSRGNSKHKTSEKELTWCTCATTGKAVWLGHKGLADGDTGGWVWEVAGTQIPRTLKGEGRGTGLIQKQREAGGEFRKRGDMMWPASETHSSWCLKVMTKTRRGGGWWPVIPKSLSISKSCSSSLLFNSKTTWKMISNIWRVFSPFTIHICGTILCNSHSSSIQYQGSDLLQVPAGQPQNGACQPEALKSAALQCLLEGWECRCWSCCERLLFMAGPPDTLFW